MKLYDDRGTPLWVSVLEVEGLLAAAREEATRKERLKFDYASAIVGWAMGVCFCIVVAALASTF